MKQFLDNRETYDEFLKLLNLYTQDVVDLRTLVVQTASFLGDSELMTQFKEIVGWEEKERRDIDGVGPPQSIQRPNKADLSIRYGPSYRKLPQNVSGCLLISDLWLNECTGSACSVFWSRCNV